MSRASGAPGDAARRRRSWRRLFASLRRWPRAGLVLALCLAAGCDEASVPVPGRLSGPGDDSRQAAMMVDGRAVVRAPAGFCVDPRSLRTARGDRFALMAPCARLGGQGGGGLFGSGAPGVITVSAAPRTPDAAPPTPDDLARAVAPAKPAEERRDGGLALIRLETPDPALPGVARSHWRGAFAVDGVLVLLAYYVPDGNDARGAALLRQIARRSVAATPGATGSE